jgi:hypothetical protein
MEIFVCDFLDPMGIMVGDGRGWGVVIAIGMVNVGLMVWP